MTNETENTFEKERIDGLLTKPTDNAYTNEWYRKQFHRLEHINRQLHAELVDTCHHARMMRKELDSVNQYRLADAAELGRVNAVLEEAMQRVAKLEARMDKASEQFAALKKTAQQVGSA